MAPHRVMAAMDSFSRRNRYAGAAKVISIREDAPEGLRVAVLEIAHYLRMILCSCTGSLARLCACALTPTAVVTLRPLRRS